VIHESKSLKCEPASEPLHFSAAVLSLALLCLADYYQGGVLAFRFASLIVDFGLARHFSALQGY